MTSNQAPVPLAVPPSVPALGSAAPSPAAPSPHSPGTRGWLLPALVLALGTFAMGTDSFVLAGILPQLASGLHVSTGSAGQVVTVFALTYALAAPLLATLTSRVPRKALMVVALALFTLANLSAAAAGDLGMLLVARAVAALAAALFTPTASAAVVSLAGVARRGVALSIILGGLAVGTVFGVPAGTALGQHLEWQASLIFIAAVAFLALAGLVVTLPALAAPPAIPLRERLAVLTNWRIPLTIVVGTLATGSGILVYTYIAQILAGTAKVSGPDLTIALLAWGAGGSIGAFGSGWLTDRYGANRTIALAIGVMSLALLALGYTSSYGLVLPVMVVGGAASWAVNAPINHRLTGLAPTLPSVVISFNSSGTYLGQALGAAVGGLLLARVDVTTICVTGAVAAAATLVVHAVITRRIDGSVTALD